MIVVADLQAGGSGVGGGFVDERAVGLDFGARVPGIATTDAGDDTFSADGASSLDCGVSASARGEAGVNAGHLQAQLAEETPIGDGVAGRIAEGLDASVTGRGHFAHDAFKIIGELGAQ